MRDYFCMDVVKLFGIPPRFLNALLADVQVIIVIKIQIVESAD